MLSFEQHFQFPDEKLVSPSVLRFLPLREVEERLADCGLCVENLYGDWRMGAFEEGSSHEMIFIARAA